MQRIFNFSAGPAMLPAEVLARAGDEMLDWHGSGMGVMEMSHRGKEFMAIAAEAEADLRGLLAVPAHYKVLFLQGGATLQFAQVPMNLLRGRTGADYVVTGEWSKKAAKEAKRYCDVHVAASSEDRAFSCAPRGWQVRPDAAYVHYCSNETIGGVEFHWIPETGGVPLVADASSHFLSRPLEVAKFGLVYAGAQKNAGPAGLTLVLVREDLLGGAGKGTPSVMDYKLQADAGSMLNTPPTYALYVAGLVFKWLKQLGGLAEIERRNVAKAKVLYDAIDAGFYASPVAKEDRSRMNVPFRLPDERLDAPFLKGAEERGMVHL
jgi:phosphoserine aminotransferase